MPVAWGHLKGHAEQQMRNNVLAARAGSEENRRLISDPGQHRMDTESLEKVRTAGHPGAEVLPRAESAVCACGFAGRCGPKSEVGIDAGAADAC
eukprot:2243756-Pyramimonas_sp.AAC.1